MHHQDGNVFYHIHYPLLTIFYCPLFPIFIQAYLPMFFTLFPFHSKATFFLQVLFYCPSYTYICHAKQLLTRLASSNYTFAPQSNF